MDYRFRCFNRRTTQAKVSLDNVKLRRLVRIFFDKTLKKKILKKFWIYLFFVFRYLDCGYDAWLYTGSGPENNWCSPYKGRILALYFFLLCRVFFALKIVFEDTLYDHLFLFWVIQQLCGQHFAIFWPPPPSSCPRSYWMPIS